MTELSAIYGARWEREIIAPAGGPSAALRAWAWALNAVTAGQAARGLERLRGRISKRGEAWPPNALEFAQLCKQPPSGDFPGIEAAYCEARLKSHPANENKYTHVAIMYAARATGSHTLAALPESVSRPIFERNYMIVCERANRGEPLGAAVRVGIAAKSSTPTPRPSAQKKLAEIRKKLGLKKGGKSGS